MVKTHGFPVTIFPRKPIHWKSHENHIKTNKNHMKTSMKSAFFVRFSRTASMKSWRWRSGASAWSWRRSLHSAARSFGGEKREKNVVGRIQRWWYYMIYYVHIYIYTLQVKDLVKLGLLTLLKRTYYYLMRTYYYLDLLGPKLRWWPWMSNSNI